MQFDIPTDIRFGDLASPEAMRKAKELHKNPMEIAQMLAQELQSSGEYARVDVVAPGYVNVFLQPKIIIQRLADAYEPPATEWSGKHIMVEYTDPNPFKEFHIGHLYSNTVGESLARLFEAGGAQVTRACYQGDVGMHVACSVWGMIEQIQQDMHIARAEITLSYVRSWLQTIQDDSLARRVQILGACYAHGASMYKKDETDAINMKRLNTQLFIAGQRMWSQKLGDAFQPRVQYQSLIDELYIDQDIVDLLYMTGREWTLAYFETVYTKLGTQFDTYYFESMMAEYGYEAVHRHIPSIFERSQGAIVFPGERYGLHTRVVINARGLPTYEAKELGLNPHKFHDYPDLVRSYVVTAHEVSQYFKVVLRALSCIAPDVAAKTEHVAHGMVRLPEGKMSSRTGNVITGDTLIAEAEQRVFDTIQKTQKIPVAEQAEVAQKIAVAAIKWSFLRGSFTKDCVFSFQESLALEGNSGPYMLYTVVRCNSILSQIDHVSFVPDYNDVDAETLLLLRRAYQYKKIISNAIKQKAPHILATYLYTLANEFNAYYAKYSILHGKPQEKIARIFATRVVHETLVRGLYILGISCVEKM